MSEDVDSIASLQMRLSIYRRTIDFLEEQRAQFGTFLPPYVRHQLDETRHEIAQIKHELCVLGQAVEDRVGDTEPVQTTHVDPFRPATINHQALLHTYRRMLIDQVRYLSLTGLSEWGDLGLQTNDVYIDRTLRPFNTNNSTEIALSDVIHTPRARVLIEGALGSGKSMFLHRLVCACTEGIDDHTAPANLQQDQRDPLPLPILISVYDLVATLQKNEAPSGLSPSLGPSAFWSAIEESLQRNDLSSLIPVIQQSLQDGQCLVLIDGLNDIELLQGGNVVTAAIGRFVARYPDNRYVITCRNRSRLPMSPLASFIAYSFVPLDEQSVDTMIAQWYTSIAKSVGVPSQEDLAECIKRLQGHLRYNPELQSFATTPLIVALCVLIDVEGFHFPNGCSVLYGRLLDTLLDRWDQLRTNGVAPTLAQALGISALAAPSQRLALLQPLGLAFQSRISQDHDEPGAMHYVEIEPLLREPLTRVFGIDMRHAIEHVIPRILSWCCLQGILAEVDIGPMYTMPDRAFREYLAARALTDLADFPTQAYIRRRDPRWHRTLTLAVRELDNSSAAHSAREFLRLLLESRQVTDVLLATECLLELETLSQIKQGLLPTIQRRLVGLLGDTTFPVAQRIQAGLLLSELGDPRLTKLLPAMARVDGGPFTFGTDEGYEDEGPVQQVHVPTFAIAVHPVTNAEFARFLAEDVTYPRPYYWYDPRYNTPSQPVVGVTWHDAMAYCKWLNVRLHTTGALPKDIVVRLPSEVEWEKAASWNPGTGRKQRFPWGDDWESHYANTLDDRGEWATTPIGCYPSGVSPYGIHDMVGNVWEWTASLYQSYPGAPLPFCEEGSYTLRGSSCASLPIHTRSTYRSRLPAHYWRYHLGFRIVVGRPL
ncbi:MAG: hypothetical protein GFH27_549287n306 [Chloroflexi bacterium AL-W]|nr:hypothetical protein [Chloroflexi bacterium AL-N1]NOK66580.1 hypothetical protein [Chloroflexi bacterium AL-N10]NOK71968.1 hypothetical protein [Chloroflexi bacterium AL-N5]NOK81225.1 hypothetical protein [Chloroflexi bacterium AL-W]NOK89498.1 hypothetical protein [Chloroflexi bacterium AL-N15]